MNRQAASLPPELCDLLADRALQGLDAEQARQLQNLLAQYPEADDNMFDRVVGQVDADASLGDAGPIPTTLDARLRETANQWCRSRTSPQSVNGHCAVQWKPVKPAAMEPAKPSSPWIRWGAMAACLLLGLILWLFVTAEDTSPAGKRQVLLIEARDIVRSSWTRTSDPSANAASGDVIWSTSWQEGYMRIDGLQANDPADWQYQLWIVDGLRPNEPPISGGVFDVPGATGEVVIPIRPDARVCEPQLFLVTIEQPGGVLVSAQERAALRAEVNSSPCN